MWVTSWIRAPTVYVCQPRVAYLPHGDEIVPEFAITRLLLVGGSTGGVSHQ